MEILIEFAKLLIPAGVVLYGMYLTVNSFLKREFEKKVVELKMKNTETVLPVRLQAYERMALYLERITPNNLVVRLNDANYSAKEFQQVLISDIRNEYNHNVSQQIYMTDDLWQMIKRSTEDIIVLINKSASGLDAEARSLDLGKKIFEGTLNSEVDSVIRAQQQLKEEIQQAF